MRAGEPIVSAYATAWTVDVSGTTKPWAMLYHDANAADTLTEITQDDIPAGMLRYVYSAQVIGDGCRDGAEYENATNNVAINGLRDPTDPKVLREYVLTDEVDEYAVLIDVKCDKIDIPQLPNVNHRASNRIEWANKSLSFKGQTTIDGGNAERIADTLVKSNLSMIWDLLNLPKVYPIQSQVLSNGVMSQAETVGYIVEYDVSFNGIPIYGDQVKLIFNGDEVVLVNARCHSARGVNNSDMEYGKKAVRPWRESAVAIHSEIKNKVGASVPYEIDSAGVYYVEEQMMNKAGRADVFVPAWGVEIYLPTAMDSKRQKHMWFDVSSGKYLGETNE
jgi:hypothetical protein